MKLIGTCLVYINKRNNSLLSKSTLNYLVIAKCFRSKYGVSKPMNIYMSVGVTAFAITCHLKER